jgi:hypothetical protein
LKRLPNQATTSGNSSPRLPKSYPSIRGMRGVGDGLGRRVGRWIYGGIKRVRRRGVRVEGCGWGCIGVCVCFGFVVIFWFVRASLSAPSSSSPPSFLLIAHRPPSLDLSWFLGSFRLPRVPLSLFFSSSVVALSGLDLLGVAGFPFRTRVWWEGRGP